MSFYVVFDYFFRFRIKNISRGNGNVEGEFVAHCGGVVRVYFKDNVYLSLALADGRVYVGGVAEKLGKLYIGFNRERSFICFAELYSLRPESKNNLFPLYGSEVLEMKTFV